MNEMNPGKNGLSRLSGSDVAGVADPGQAGRPQPNPGSATPATSEPKTSRLWLWFVAAFMIQAAAWVVWFTIAAKHRIEEVPLTTEVGR